MSYRLSILTLTLSLAAAAAQAQTTPSTETLFDGDVDSGFLLAPDFKFTEIDGGFATLGGAYGGWVLDRKVLLGGGVYTLVDGRDGAEMTYGGGVLEYFVNPSKLVNLSFRGLVGGGSATLGAFGGGVFESEEFPFAGFGRGGAGGRRGARDSDFQSLTGTRSSSFFIAEPEANVNLNLTKLFRLGFGGGYRFTGGARGLDGRLDGFFARAALKLSFF